MSERDWIRFKKSFGKAEQVFTKTFPLGLPSKIVKASFYSDSVSFTLKDGKCLPFSKSEIRKIKYIK